MTDEPHADRQGPALVRDLSRAEAYPWPRPWDVRVLATHASWVFLTPSEAWKVKRPVDFGFLDFSSPERRRQCCEDEVRLGRRLAPDTYRGVAPIHLGDHGHSFCGHGPVVDHAVRMHRVPDEDCAAALLASHTLTPAHMAALAARLAAFYAETPATPAFGDPTFLRMAVADNHTALQTQQSAAIDRPTADRLHRWQLGQLVAHEARLRRRVSEGRVRDGHGDLRLEHVYFRDGKPEHPFVLDPIEWNDSFRCIDAALDVAFFAMELHAQGRGDLASYFLSCFARSANDYGFFPLLDLFLVYRACVRAKVACLVAAATDTRHEKRARKAREARRLIDLAADISERAKPGSHVVVVSGLIGVGKSTVADLVSQTFPAVVVSSDLTRKHLAGLRPDDRGSEAIYTPAASRATYDEMLRRARDVLSSGRSVILDGTFRRAEDRADARLAAAEHGARFTYVELDADDEILRERLARPRAERHGSDATEALLARMRSEWRRPADIPAAERLELSARQPPETLAAAVIAAMKRREEAPA